MARKTGSVNHIHQYFLRPDALWACSGLEVGCTHYMPRNMYPAPVGYMSICWACPKVFRLTPVNMTREKPLCDVCAEIQARMDKVQDEYFSDVAEKNPYAGLTSSNPLEQLLKRAKMHEEEERRKKELEEPDQIENIGPDDPIPE